MVELYAGFPLVLNNEQLVFGPGVTVRETKARTRGELAPVAFEAEACVPGEAVQYWMYNDIATAAWEARRSGMPVQYELTLVLPASLGHEKSKTFGHIHNAPAPAAPTFAEVYEVVFGVAHFLVWTLDAGKTRVPFCGYIEAHAGDVVVMPPNLYHLTINGSAEPLVFADLISTRARGIYDEVRAKHGGPYYELTDGAWLTNPEYADAAPRVPCDDWKPELVRPLFEDFAANPEAYDWLVDPALFPARFPDLKLFLS